MRKNKAKPASSKRGKKKTVKIKDLPAKDLENREVLGGAAAPNLAPTEIANREVLGGATLRRPDALNLGL